MDHKEIHKIHEVFMKKIWATPVTERAIEFRMKKWLDIVDTIKTPKWLKAWRTDEEYRDSIAAKDRDILRKAFKEENDRLKAENKRLKKSVRTSFWITFVSLVLSAIVLFLFVRG